MPLQAVLIHWNAAEAAPRVAELRAAGFNAEHFLPQSGAGLRVLRDNPPDAILIDLARLPSQGRAVGIELRKHKATRYVPLVFVGGEPEKVAATRKLLPDAVYAEWTGIAAAVQRAVASPPVNPAAPDTMAGYSGTPLPKKLGIKAGTKVMLLGAPDGFEESLPGAAIVRSGADLALLFADSRASLDRRFGRAARASHVWLLWPKKASGAVTDLDEKFVRAYGLARGWVDYKICSVDATWSGLLFAKRKGTAP